MNQTNTPSSATAAQFSALQSLADKQLSWTSRLGHVALLLGALTMTGIVSALWLTEPHLPVRTQVAFAVIAMIGLSWTVFAVWVLRYRQVLLADQNVVAGRMAVAFTSLLLLGALSLAFMQPGPKAYAVVAVGAGLLASAVALLWQSHRAFNRLLQRRQALERELAEIGK